VDFEGERDIPQVVGRFPPTVTPPAGTVPDDPLSSRLTLLLESSSADEAWNVAGDVAGEEFCEPKTSKFKVFQQFQTV
jgi:hypothetical protein